MLEVFLLVDLIHAYSKRHDLLFDLVETTRALDKAREAEAAERTSVQSTGRVAHKWQVEDQLGEVNVKLLIKQYQEGTVAADLAERYKISLSSVRRLLKKYGGRLKDI